MTFVLNVTLTCYSKKGAILNFGNMADTRGNFKLCYYFET